MSRGTRIHERVTDPAGYRVGDPDPTCDGLDLDNPDEFYCSAGADGWAMYLCTWPAGHGGPHVAGTGYTIAAVWT